MSTFEQPAAPSGGIAWADHLGALILVEPLSFEVGIQTTFGVADAVRANVYVIEGAGAGEYYDSTLAFPKLLSSQLKGQIGKRVLGRLGQGPIAKAGQSAPWILNEASPEDIAKAEAWVAERSKSAISSASPPF